jgi:hypothetical protein
MAFDHRRQAFGSAVGPVRFSKVSNIDQRPLCRVGIIPIAARLLAPIGDRALLMFPA